MYDVVGHHVHICTLYMVHPILIPGFVVFHASDASVHRCGDPEYMPAPCVNM